MTGPDGFTGFSGLTASSGFVTLPTAGTYKVTVGTIGAGIGSYAFQLLQTSQSNLTLGVPYQANLAGNGQGELFAVSVPTLEPLLATLQDTSSDDQNELYVSYGSPPTRSDYQYRYSNLAAANQQVLVPSAAPGTWYILLYAGAVPSPSTYTMTATASEVLLTGITPAHHGNIENTTVMLSGAGFTVGTTVSLINSSGTTYPLTNPAINSLTQMSATIPANAVPAGTYTVQVTAPGGITAQLPGAFNMIQGGEATLVTKLVIPSPIGNASPAVLYVEYSNTGDIAMPAPLLVLSATNANGNEGAIMTLNAALQFTGPEILRSSEPVGYSSSVEILASGATPGLLQPGESITVPVYYAGWITTVPDYPRSAIARAPSSMA